LNPHFLFNALASIRGAITGDAEAAREMIGTLGEYCRLTLTHAQRDLLPLSEELAIARLYLSMDQARRRDPIDVDWQIASGLDETLMPTFLLQPLVENAVKYGRHTCQADRLRVRLEVTRTAGGAVLVRVSNTGMWVEPSPGRRDSLGVGLENVRRRLRHHFGEQGALSTQHGNGWVHVSVTLPTGSVAK
jgi:LytS/YehU family sensor histidine kinase